MQFQKAQIGHELPLHNLIATTVCATNFDIAKFLGLVSVPTKRYGELDTVRLAWQFTKLAWRSEVKIL